jgi:hypothetical protein
MRFLYNCKNYYRILGDENQLRNTILFIQSVNLVHKFIKKG